MNWSSLAPEEGEEVEEAEEEEEAEEAEEVISTTSQNVVLHPFVHVSTTAPVLFRHVAGSGGAMLWYCPAAQNLDPSREVVFRLSATGKSGAPGTISSHPDPPPVLWFEHQNPPFGV